MYATFVGIILPLCAFHATYLYCFYAKIRYSPTARTTYLMEAARGEIWLIYIFLLFRTLNRDFVFYATFGEERSTKPAMANWVAVKMAQASVAIRQLQNHLTPLESYEYISNVI